MQSGREEDLDAVSRDITWPVGGGGYLSPLSDWPWLPYSSSSAATDKQRLRPPSFSAHPDSMYHHVFHNHDFRVELSSVASPSVEWRVETVSAVEAVYVASPTSTESQVDGEEPRKARDEGAAENEARREEEEEEANRSREEPLVSSNEDGGTKWRNYIVRKPFEFATSLWRKLGPEMADKIDGENVDPKKTALLQKLQNLTEREEIDRRRLSAQRRDVRRRKSEMFATVEMNAILQGVIYAAVADTSGFRCGDLWGPLTLVSAVTVVAIVALFVRYRELHEQKSLLRRMENGMRDLKNRSQKIKQSVLAEDVSALPIDLDKVYSEIPRSLYFYRTEEEAQSGRRRREGDVRQMWRPVFWTIVTVSVGIINAVSCSKILCCCD